MMGIRGLWTLTSLTAAVAAATGWPLAAQDPVQRILDQDSALNNLVDPLGYETAPLGTLGDVRKVGSGPTPMILVPGLGFGADVFQPLMERWAERHTMYAVTLPGMAGAAPVGR